MAAAGFNPEFKNGPGPGSNPDAKNENHEANLVFPPLETIDCPCTYLPYSTVPEERPFINSCGHTASEKAMQGKCPICRAAIKKFHIFGLTDAIVQHNAVIKQRNEDLLKLMEQHDKLKSNIQFDGLKQDFAALDKSLKEARVQLNDALALAINKEETISQLRTELGSTNNQLKEAAATQERLTRTIGYGQQLAENQNKTIAELKDKLSSEERLRSRFEGDLLDSYKTGIVRKSEVKALHAKVKNLEQDNTEKDQLVQQLKQENAQLRRLIQHNEHQFVGLEQTLVVREQQLRHEREAFNNQQIQLQQYKQLLTHVTQFIDPSVLAKLMVDLTPATPVLAGHEAANAKAILPALSPLQAYSVVGAAAGAGAGSNEVQRTHIHPGAANVAPAGPGAG